MRIFIFLAKTEYDHIVLVHTLQLLYVHELKYLLVSGCFRTDFVETYL